MRPVAAHDELTRTDGQGDGQQGIYQHLITFAPGFYLMEQEEEQHTHKEYIRERENFAV